MHNEPCLSTFYLLCFQVENRGKANGLTISKGRQLEAREMVARKQQRKTGFSVLIPEIQIKVVDC